MVKTGQIAIYYGAGKGKTSVSLGKGVRALGENLRVVMIQFMDYHNNQEIALLEKLEPDFRIFHFEKNRDASEIRNAFNFTKKILDTGECDMLMLDGILECVEENYLSEEEVVEMMEKRPNTMDMILTGASLPESIAQKADHIYQIVTEK